MKIGVFVIITKSQIAKFTIRKLEPERKDFALLNKSQNHTLMTLQRDYSILIENYAAKIQITSPFPTKENAVNVM